MAKPHHCKIFQVVSNVGCLLVSSDFLLLIMFALDWKYVIYSLISATGNYNHKFGLMMPSPLGWEKSLESFERKKLLSTSVCSFSVSVRIQRYIVLCCTMTFYFFLHILHFLKWCISWTYLWLMFNFESKLQFKFRLVYDSQARHTTLVFLLTFFCKEKGVSLPSFTFVQPQNDFNV